MNQLKNGTTLNEVWVDLEETIIESWQSYLYQGILSSNSQRVKRWLTDNNIKEINIFSAAIYDEKDKLTFEESMKSEIEQLLNVSIDSYPTVEEVMKIAKKYDKLSYESIFDYIQLNGKFFSFFKFIMSQYNSGKFVLIDDCVDNWSMHNKRNGMEIEFINAIQLYR